jgi:hypothetical protein
LQHFAELNGRLPCLELDDKALSHARGRGQLGLGQFLLMTGGLNRFPDIM